MPRPIRIEYSGAFHHVMNRGRSHQKIFHDETYFEEFLKTLREASEQFDAVIHAYCLMSNHYHLLIETPKANLNRIMQHINGLYTQRYNRKRKRDGTLFRGRYKAILVDQDEYLLQLSRYIHRNPIEMKNLLVNQLENYPWSSYQAYINNVKAPEWLHREKTYQMLGQKKRYKGYANYVGRGIDEDIRRYYSKGNILSVLGDNEFRELVREEASNVDLPQLRKALQDRPTANDLIMLIGSITKTSDADIRRKSTGRRNNRPVRAFAMYACHYYGGLGHNDIAKEFELSSVGSASYPINRIKKEIEAGGWKKEIRGIEHVVYIVK